MRTECIPLVVDLDGTLIRTDLLVDSAFAHLGQRPEGTGRLLMALSRGKAAVKAHIAATTEVDPAHLPYDDQVIDIIRRAREQGRPVYLASASNERYVGAVASHLGLFEGWFASTAAENLSSVTKAGRLVTEFGERGFDYIGNGRADLGRVGEGPAKDCGTSLIVYATATDSDRSQRASDSA